MPLRLEAAILSRTRSPISSRSNWANDSRTLSVSRPMLELVLKDCVTDTNETSWASNSSMSLAKSASERVSRSTFVDAQGRLIAHPDISLVLRNTDMSKLAQVRAARASASGGAGTGDNPSQTVQEA